MQHDAHFYKLRFLFHNAKLMLHKIVVESVPTELNIPAGRFLAHILHHMFTVGNVFKSFCVRAPPRLAKYFSRQYTTCVRPSE